MWFIQITGPHGGTDLVRRRQIYFELSEFFSFDLFSMTPLYKEVEHLRDSFRGVVYVNDPLS